MYDDYCAVKLLGQIAIFYLNAQNKCTGMPHYIMIPISCFMDFY